MRLVFLTVEILSPGQISRRNPTNTASAALTVITHHAPDSRLCLFIPHYLPRQLIFAHPPLLPLPRQIHT